MRKNIGKYIVYFFLAIMCPMNAMAQSSMTDDQVMRFVLKEYESGTTNQQIITKLMQNGVDIQQIRRVRKKMERQQKETGLGVVTDPTATTDADGRLRKSNATPNKIMSRNKKKTNVVYDDDEDEDEYMKYTNSRLRKTKKRQHSYDEDDEEYLEMEEALYGIIPMDSIEWLEKILENQKKKDKPKVFGRDIFNNDELSFEPNMNIATPQDYILGPGDEVIIDIYGASQKTVEATVSPDGEVTIEDFGPVQVSGLTVSQANSRLRTTLGPRYSSSKVKLTVGQTRTIMVHVMGEVEVPGSYTLSAFATVFHALYMAGGTNEIGTLRNIKVYRRNKLVSTVDIYDYILNGKQSSNIKLADDDIIIVGAYDCLVNIAGKVKRPMFYEMKTDESVGTLLKYAGGFSGDAYTKSVRVTRKTGREFSVHVVKEFDMASFHMADGDSVSVDSILDRYENTVEVKGAVFHPGKYHVGGDITTVKQLLEAAEGVTEEAFTKHAVMHRMKEDRTLKAVQVDIDGILDGSVPDLPLQSNDVLFVPTKQEMMEEQTLKIYGEVHYPGTYIYAENETIEDFILQAGGLKDNASSVKVDVSRRIKNPKALTTDSLIAYTYSFALKDGFVIDGEPGFTLMPFDEVYVRNSPGYYEQQNVEIEGEVMFSGTYTLSKKNQRLSDLIKAAGGVNDRAYIKGARIERKYNQEERLRAIAVLKKAREENETNLQEIAMKTSNASFATLNSTQQMQKYEIGETYPVGIELDKALKNPGGSEDIVLREGDKLIVPQYNGTVKINGEVMYPNTVSYRDGKNVAYYIDQAGGWSNKAKKNQAYIIYMNGTVAKVGHNAKVLPGCEIVVPAKPINKTSMAETLSVATSIGSLAAIIATLANIFN